MANFCTVDHFGDILVVTMNRPDKLNSLPSESHLEMQSIWDSFFEDSSLRVGILTGAGDRAFCAGSDLSGYQTGYDGTLPRSGAAGLTHRLGRRKPVIAAVNGLAFGGGFEVMLACDMAVAVETAEFSLPEVLVGAGAFGGGIPRLCRKIPHAIALELVLTGRRMSAVEAHRLGLVNRVVAKGDAQGAAMALAREILRAAPLASEASKCIADMALEGSSLSDILTAEDGELKHSVIQSQDFQEGIKAFFEKRAPVWQGK